MFPRRTEESSRARRSVSAAQDYLFHGVCAAPATVVRCRYHAALRAAPQSDSFLSITISSAEGRSKKQSLSWSRATRRRNEPPRPLLRPHDRRAIRRAVPHQRANQDRRHRRYASPLGLASSFAIRIGAGSAGILPAVFRAKAEADNRVRGDKRQSARFERDLLTTATVSPS